MENNMFKENKRHLEQNMFSPEIYLSEKALFKFKQTKESFFFELVFRNIDEKLFKVLYSDEGSPNAPINTMVSSLILKEKKGISFEDFFNQMRFDLLTRQALGLNYLDFGSLPYAPATLFNFMNRLKKHEEKSKENLLEKLFDNMTLNQIKELKLKTDIQRSDSTMISSNIRKYGRLELLIEVLIRFYRVLIKDKNEGKCVEYLIPYVKENAQHYIYALKPADIEGEINKIAAVYQIMQVIYKEEYKETEEFKILERVFGEHFAIEKEKIIVKEIKSGVTQSPDDLDATYRKKGKSEGKGFSLNITETCNPDNPLQLITDIAVEKNNKNDNEILEDRLEKIVEKTDLKELHTDGQYGSEENDKFFKKNNIEHIQTAICGKEAEVKIEIKEMEEGKYEVSCPMQKTVSRMGIKRQKACFEKRVCEQCEMREKCPAVNQKKYRVYYFTEKDVLRKERIKRYEKLSKEKKKLRANVEASVKEFKEGTKNGKVKVRGMFKVKIFAYCKGIGVNFGRIMRYWWKNSIKNSDKLGLCGIN